MPQSVSINDRKQVINKNINKNFCKIRTHPQKVDFQQNRNGIIAKMER